MTQTINIETAKILLDSCAAVIIDQNAVVYPGSTDEGSVFLFLSWDDEGEVYEYTFDEDDNKEVKIDDRSMILKDSEGEEVSLQLLVNWNLIEAIVELGEPDGQE